jgi:hypothetical protein
MNNFHVPLVPGGPGASAVQGVCIFSVIGVLLGGVLGAAATIDIQSTAIIAIAGGGYLAEFSGCFSAAIRKARIWSTHGSSLVMLFYWDL